MWNQKFLKAAKFCKYPQLVWLKWELLDNHCAIKILVDILRT